MTPRCSTLTQIADDVKKFLRLTDDIENHRTVTARVGKDGILVGLHEADVGRSLNQ